MEEPAVELVENGVREEAGLIDCQRQLHKKKGGGGNKVKKKERGG